mgnify:CR=1 FL=1
MKYDALIYGPIFCDMIFTDLPHMPRLGQEIFAKDLTITVGGSAIVAVGLHRLGAKVGLIADLGNDPMSQLMADLLKDSGLDLSLVRHHDQALPQITVALSFPEDRAFVTRFERPDTPIDLAPILRNHSAKHLHLGSFLGAFDMPDAPTLAHTAGMTVSLDPGWDEVALRDHRLRDIVSEVDYFLPSRSELCAMMETEDVQQALTQATTLMHRGTVVMKDGPNDAIASDQNHQVSVPALSVSPVDTTGAGDSFDAGFIYSLVNGNDLKTNMTYGAICGALTTTVVGGAIGTPTLEEVQKWL